MVFLYSFKVGGTEIGYADGAGPNYVLEGTKIELSRENQNGNVARIKVVTTAISAASITAGNEVIISRGQVSSSDKVIFKGNVKEIQTNDDDTVTLLCADPLQKLKYNLFVQSYDRNIDSEAGELSEIFKDIAETGGFTVSRVRSGTAASDITVDKFISNNNSRLNRMNLIQKILNWVFYYDYANDFIRLEPKGYTTYPITLNVGTNIVNIPVWEENIEQMRNKITVTGAAQLDTRVDTFTGDGSTTEYTLTYVPESIETTVDGTLQELGITGSTTGFDYSLDKDRQTITFETAPGNTLSIVVTYTTFIPTPVTDFRQSSIDQYGLTQEEEYTFNDVVTVADAEVRVKQLLGILSLAELSTSIFTDEFDIKVGQKILYANSNNSTYDGEYIVTSKNIIYGQEYDVIKIGTPKIDLRNIFITIDERLKLLEEGDRGLGEILRFLITLVRNALIYRRKTFKIERRNMTNSFIIGHQTLGRLRTGFDMEADCSDNGNHGTWEGTGVTTGTQFETSSEAGGVFTTPVVRLGCGIGNGTDRRITSTGVSEAGIRCISLFILPDGNTDGLFIVDTGKYISTDGSGNVTTTGLTNVTIEETDLGGGVTHVYVEFDAETMVNPTALYDGTNYFDGKVDEIQAFDTTLSATDKTLIQNGLFYSNSDKFSNCKLWWSCDNPLIGDRRTNYVTEVNTTY